MPTNPTGRWASPFQEIVVGAQHPMPAPTDTVAAYTFSFDGTILGYLCWGVETSSVAWYPTISPRDNGWSIVQWIEDELRENENTTSAILKITMRYSSFISNEAEDILENVASDAAIDHKL